MYLISIYFDEQTSASLEKLIKRVAEATDNTFMLDNQVPPHITVAAVETRREDELLDCINQLVCESRNDDERVLATRDMSKSAMRSGELQWVSVGAFFPQVLFVQPVLNEYLHNLSVVLSEKLSEIEETIVSPYYQPFGWLPHCTIAKQLTKEQMVEAFKVLQQHFVPMEGRVTRIGVARTNPHRDIKVWEFK
ncbi:MAG: 2'-5' RNA ligase family protein [Lachnospiraceae bacterium]|nr:2'-5' RNA ligase family protein [Lachnospiraceae bacterium]